MINHFDLIASLISCQNILKENSDTIVYRKEKSINSLLMEADQIVHNRKVRNRKLWINRQRPMKQLIKSWIPILEKGWQY